jgi:hypothetical protein
MANRKSAWPHNSTSTRRRPGRPKVKSCACWHDAGGGSAWQMRNGLDSLRLWNEIRDVQPHPRSCCAEGDQSVVGRDPLSDTMGWSPRHAPACSTNVGQSR